MHSFIISGNWLFQDTVTDFRDRRRHSSADEMRTRLLEKQALERKDSNQSTSSETSLELQSYLPTTSVSGSPRERALSDSTQSHVKQETSTVPKTEEEEVFSSATR